MPRSITIDVSVVASVDLAIVDAIARLQLAARRSGFDVVVINAQAPLLDLLELTGLLGPISARPADADGA